MPVNPICGRNGCKYKVPHEHVQFTPQTLATEQIQSVAAEAWKKEGEQTKGFAAREEAILSQYGRPKNSGADVSVIEKALLSLGASDDPEADRFGGLLPEEARIKILQEHIAKLSDRFDRFAETVTKALAAFTLQQDHIKAFAPNMVEIRQKVDYLASRQNATPFAKIVLGVVTGGFLLVGSTIVLIAAGVKIATLIWG